LVLLALKKRLENWFFAAHEEPMSLSCLACNQTDLQRVRRYRLDTSYGREVFGDAWLHMCKMCGLVQMVPRPAPRTVADNYVQDYRRGGLYGSDVADANKFPKDNLFYYNRGLSIAELISPHIGKANPQILDIGAGFGHILHAFGQRHPRSRRLAIEFSDICVQHLTSLGVQVFTQPVEEVLPRMEQRFDVIVLSHVFEHLLDPRGILDLIHASLAPDGVLYIEVPNIPAESLLRYPDHVWAPRFDEPHITFFSALTLRQMLTSASFEPVFCDTAGAEYTNISWLRFHLPHWRWFLQRLIPPPLFHWLRRQKFTQPIRVPERVESFYQYGGFRIWIRSISRKKTKP
jgi:SAM-dependent methyltransferase